jgi:hypothetical protein
MILLLLTQDAMGCCGGPAAIGTLLHAEDEMVRESKDKVAKHVERFEFDLATPFFEQILRSFELLRTAPLTRENIGGLERSQGVYGLCLDAKLVYLGKAEKPLPERLADHRFKIEGRQGISLGSVSFKALYLARTWVPLAPEKLLIEHYRAEGLCDWNGNGFGPHDPGRNRETTDKRPEGFDAQYPIRADWPCTEVAEGSHEANDLLQRIKGSLPFCFRYETDRRKAWKEGSTKYKGKQIVVPKPGMPASDLIAVIARELGPTWQATRFPGHIILYEERKDYRFGQKLE